MANCKGCGALLQSDNPQAPGYTPKKDGEYCQRCFRLMHYDDLTSPGQKGMDSDEVISRIAAMDCLVLWVVDLFDFEAGMISGINRKLAGKDIIMAAAKRDILPDELNHERIARFVFSRLKAQGISIKGLILTGKLHREGMDELMEAVRMFSKKRPIAVMGKANAGKSTLLNNLMHQDILASSRYPGTTQDFVTMQIDGYTFIDTPGLEVTHSMINAVAEKDLRIILPSRTIQPRMYTVTGDQSFAAGGLVRVDLMGCDAASCVFYMADDLPVHRSKVSAADDLWLKHYGELFSPVPLDETTAVSSIHKNLDKMDIVIDGLGWICVKGQISTIHVKTVKNVNVTFRKAML